MRLLFLSVQIIGRRREEDPRLVMLAGFRKAGEFREFAQRDVHAEGAAARLEALDPALEVSRQVAGVHQPLVKQLRTDIGDHARRGDFLAADELDPDRLRSEEHTSELQSLMRISYAVFC